MLESRWSSLNFISHTINPVSNYNINPASPFQLTPEVLRSAMAGRLAAKIFTEEELLVSNFRGKCNKNKLDDTKTDAIRRACIAEFPLRSHENGYIMERHRRRGRRDGTEG